MSIAEGHYIYGVTLAGNKFRPSDWIERLASVAAGFQHGRLQYHAAVQPCQHAGQKCLFVGRTLADAEPALYQFMLDFAQHNQLQIEDTNPEQSFKDVA